MAKRVSLKGRGAEIFFGGDLPDGDLSAEPTSEDALEPTAASSSEPSSLDPSSPLPVSPSPAEETDQASAVPGIPSRSKQARMRASKDESILASKQASVQEEMRRDGVEDDLQTLLGGDLLKELWVGISEQAAITNAFRYTERELAQLTDTHYEIVKRYDAKLSKQDIVRLGLDVVLLDYHRRGAASLLGQFASRRKRQRGGVR